MEKKFQFKPKYKIETLPPSELLILEEGQNPHLLQGAIYFSLAPFLKKGVDPNQIVDKLGEKFSASEIYYTFLRLEEKGYIEEIKEKLSPPLATFASLLGLEEHLASQKLQTASVAIHSFGKISQKKIEQNFKHLAIPIDPNGKLAVVVADDYRTPKIRGLARQIQTPWLLAKVFGSQIWLGPILSSAREYEHLLLRLKMNFQEEVKLEKGDQIFPQSKLHLKTNVQIGLSLLANEVLKWIWGAETMLLKDHIFVFDSVQMEWSSHALLIPHEHIAPAPLTLNNYSFSLCKISPEETWRRYQHVISPITGIVRMLHPLKHKDEIIQVFGASYSETALQQFLNRPFLNENLQSSGGKGKTEEEAKASCLCEAIERYSGRYQGNEPKRRGSLQELGSDAIHPNRCQNYSKTQLANADDLNAKAHSFHWVAKPFNETHPMDWTPVWSLTSKRYKWIPTAYCYYGAPEAKEEGFCRGDSNGCAAGNTLEEAILQGFFELIERDSVAIWWYNRLSRPSVDIGSFKDSFLNRLVERYQKMERKMWVLDLTFDLQIPAFAAISCSRANENIILGFGAHFDAKIAITRACTELNQSLDFPNAVKGNAIALNWFQSATLDQNPYLLPNAPAKKFSDYPPPTYEFSFDAISLCQKLVEEKGMEFLVLDQTRPETKLPVVKVIVPGLRHMWNRLGPGRLYDVPVQLGLLEKPLKEEELNPTPLFI